MKKATSATLSLILAFGIVISLSSPSIARQEEMQSVEGNIVCIEVDKEGNLITLEEYTECKGLLVLVGKDGKTYTLSGSELEMKMLATDAVNRISGKIEGNQRAWRLYASTLEPKEPQKSVEKIITGTIVCLIPDYAKGNVKPIVATGPCNEL
ncbi:MAG: hypothetical protein ACE5H1_12125, partial [Thermodesulfobacteriota bacterium]